MDKLIKKSNRGLTFSFPSSGKLSIGSRYDYIISKDQQSIRICAAQNGRYKLSRKRRGETWYSLVDLRNKEVLDAVSSMSQLRVSFEGDDIVIRDASAKKAGKKGIILRFPRIELANLRIASGMSSTYASGQLLEGVQITLDEFLSSRSDPINVSTIQKDLSDIYTVVSLFSGAGILDWPFVQDDRFNITYAIDYEAAACETYRQNCGMHIVHGDVHKAFTDNGYPLDATVESPDVIIGGPSCKPFSNANRHTRLADHPDSDLVVQYMRIVKKLRPKVFAMENVPEVLTACDGAYFDAIKDAAKEAGYELTSKIVQDNKVGGYTTRKRAVILGSRIGPATFCDVSLCSGGKTAGDALEKVNITWTNYADVTIPGPETKKRMSFVPQGGNYTSIPQEYQTGSKNRHSCTYRRLAWNEPSPTIVNWRKPPLIHPTEDRTLTVAEAKALQGLPGSFKICGSLGQMQQQVGNSVPVAIGRFIKEQILNMLRQGRASLSPSAATV